MCTTEDNVACIVTPTGNPLHAYHAVGRSTGGQPWKNMTFHGAAFECIGRVHMWRLSSCSLQCAVTSQIMLWIPHSISLIRYSRTWAKSLDCPKQNPKSCSLVMTTFARISHSLRTCKANVMQRTLHCVLEQDWMSFLAQNLCEIRWRASWQWQPIWTLKCDKKILRYQVVGTTTLEYCSRFYHEQRLQICPSEVDN